MLKNLYRFLSPRYQALFLEYRTRLVPRYGRGKPPHEMLYGIINSHRNEYETILRSSASFFPSLQQIKQKSKTDPSNDIVWNNAYLPGLDLAMIYTMLALKRPANYIEVGSGYSTLTVHKCIRELRLGTKITSIDPQPRAEIEGIADMILKQRFEDIDHHLILDLRENDILFIDNSHRILPNSDSMVFFLEVLPRLRKGVIVHIHDVYLPFDYPDFMCERFYSEQYGLAICLLANPLRYRPILPNYFISQDVELSRIMDALWDHPNLQGVERHGGSFWLQIGTDV